MLSTEQLHLAATEFGTPLYVYSADRISAAVAEVREAFADARIFYAMKANSNMHILQRLQGFGLGMECVSLGELLRAQYIGIDGEKIILNGPAKSEAEYKLASKLGATFILDRIEEIELLPPRSRVLLRVNPAIDPSTHSHLATGSAGSKFGLAVPQVAGAMQELVDTGHTALGLHVHIGSAIRDPADFSRAFSVLAELKNQIGSVRVLDVGGGWDLGADLKGIAAAAAALAHEFGAELWVEPGRYLVAEAGFLLTRVVGTKKTGRNFCLVDAGMTELLRPMLYGAKHEVIPLWSGETEEVWDIAGPACESGDLLARGIVMPMPKRGDLLAVAQAGAYGAAMSSNYLSRPRPAEVLFEYGEWQMIRKAETHSDIWRQELV